MQVWDTVARETSGLDPTSWESSGGEIAMC